MISIIIEWDNVRLSEASRAIDMLQSLHTQARQMDQPVEFLLMFNDQEIPVDTVDQIGRTYLAPQGSASHNTSYRLIPVSGATYYELKNRGAQLAHGDILVFVDSDVLLEDGWLENLIRPMEAKPDMQVIAGETYLAINNLMNKAFALHWFFPFRTTTSELHPNGRYFFANNVAFRRALFLAHPFPPVPPGMTRGSCAMLARQLTAMGIAIWINTAAKAEHPAPNGWRHFFLRGLAQGRDWAMNTRAGQPAGPWRLSFRALSMLLTRLRRIAKATWRKGDQVQLPAWQYPLAVAIMWAYAIAMFLGAVMTAFRPESAQQAWQL